MKRWLCVWSVLASATVVQAGVINIYEPDAGGNGNWLITGGTDVTILRQDNESIDFTVDIGTNAASSQNSRFALLDSNREIDDVVSISTNAGSSVIEITVDSLDLDGPRAGGKGRNKIPKLRPDDGRAPEQSGLNFVGTVALEDEGNVDVYLQSASVPAPSSLVMLLGAATALGLPRMLRRRTSAK